MDKRLLNFIWQQYLKLCGNEHHAKNAMKKALGKQNSDTFRSADFTEADIDMLLRDLAYRDMQEDNPKTNSPEDLGFVR